MKKLLMLLLLPLLLQGCTKDGEADIIHAGIGLLVSDEQGNDLLDPASTSPKAVNVSKLKMYEVIDGKEVLFYKPHLDHPNGIGLFPPGGDRTHYKLGFGFYTKTFGIGLDKTTTILEWEDGHRDVFKAEIYHGDNAIIQRKIWVNGRLIWDPANKIGSTQPMYEIKR